LDEIRTLDPVVEDLSAWIIAGQVTSTPRESEWASTYRTPAQGIADGVEAERLGFRRVFLSERWNFKEAGAFLGGVAARTSRLEVGTGVMAAPTRHPQLTAALGATMHASYGPRFVLALGLGVTGYFEGMGMRATSYRALLDYVDILRRLWRGETVHYDGPVGRYDALSLGYPFDMPTPALWFGTFANPKGAETAAAGFDGVQLPPIMTPEASAAAVGRIKAACERIGRDPNTIRIVQGVVTAPDLDDFESRALAHARALTYLATPVYGRAMCLVNGWDPALADRVAAELHKRAADGKTADWGLHRIDLMDATALVPDSLMGETCALGSVDACVKTLRAFRDAGVDEIGTYGSTPAQNAGLIKAWRQSSDPS
jgi:probable F420-dependent oxidoreductase